MKPNLTKFPKTDCNYTAVALTGSCASRVAKRSFWKISDDYFQNEEPQEFAGEGALFVVIVMTAAVAMLINASALHDFVRALGAA